MEKLHHIGLLSLNFAVLNILLSLIFFLISIAGKRLLTSPLLKSRLFFASLITPPALSMFTILTSFVPPIFIKIPGKSMFCLNDPYCYIFSFVSPEIPFFDWLLILAAVLVLLPVIYSLIGIRNYFKIYANIDGITNPSLIPPRPPLEGVGTNSPLVKEDSGGLARHPIISKSVLKELKELEDVYKIRVKVIDTPYMISFLWGYISNILVISTGVLNRLSKDELRCLLAHEISHYKRRENILKGILLLCRNSLFITPHVYSIFRWWREEIEKVGDEKAAIITGRPLDVASAILKMMVSSSHGNPPFNKDGMKYLDSYAIGFSITRSNHLLTDRIERLVAINDCVIRPGGGQSIIPSETGLLIGMTSIFSISFIAIYELNPLLIHCYIERLLSLV